MPAITYPFLLLAGPYLLYSTLESSSKAEAGGSVHFRSIEYCSAIMVCYSLVRLVGGYTAPFSNDSFPF